MHAEPRVSYLVFHEIQGLTERVGASTSARCATRPRRILDSGGRRLPRDRSLDRAAMGCHLPRPGRPGPGRSPGPGPAAEADLDPGEDHPALADREPVEARVRDRVVDRPTPGPVDPRGIRHPTQPAVPQRLAAEAGIHPAEAPTSPARATRRRSLRGWRPIGRASRTKHGGRAPTSPCSTRAAC
jgi:hypothetical protein